MHSFQPSRGRILFEVFCALAVVASMVGAWQQTQASALLTAAAAAGLYAMVRLFDLGRHDPAQVEEPQRIEFEPVAQDAVPATPAVEVLLAAVEPLPPAREASTEEIELVEPAPRKGAGRRKGGSRKTSGRRTSAPKVAEVIELVPDEVEVAEPAPVEVAPVAVVPVEDASFAEPASVEHVNPVEADASEEPDFVNFADENHGRIAPLFEPEPFARMPRRAFGRRGRL